MPRPMTTKEHLIAARALIEKGWLQGKFWAFETNLSTFFTTPKCLMPLKSAHCMVGALMDISDTPYGVLGGPAYNALVLAIDPLHNPDHYFNLSVWNDAPGRTKEQVLAVFDIAIANLEE